MIDELDETLRKLLLRELPVKNGEVNIEFDQPKREWSAKLSRPTLNLFLYDIREDVKLRQSAHHWVAEQANNHNANMRRQPVRVELHYLVTAWAKEPEDEHRLLSRTLMALFRFPELPENVLPEILRGQPAPIATEIAQRDGLPNPADFWSAMDNEIRPGLLYTVHLALDPYKPTTTPIVTVREISFIAANTNEVESVGLVLWGVRGTIFGLPPMQPVRMTLVEKELEVPVAYDGAFAIRGLAEGEYTLEISVAGGAPTRHKLIVPSRDYVIEL